MDKYMNIFCKQNPRITLPCGNPNCKKEHTFKSADVLKHKLYRFECSYCGTSTEIDTSKFTKDFISELKNLGVYLG